MAAASNRFECLADPCDLWTVWDRWGDAPAQSLGTNLVGLTQAEALAQCTTLNADMFGADGSTEPAATPLTPDRGLPPGAPGSSWRRRRR